MMSLAATVIALCAIVSAAPPARRDEWQPFSSTVSWPTGAPVPAPTEHPNTGWQPQGNQTCIYITNNYEWMGYGINLCNPAGVCSDKLPDGLSGQVLSAGPSEDQVCFLYSDEYCTGETSAPIVNPGYDDLEDIDFDNVAKSWKCYKMWPPGSTSSSPTSTPSYGTSATQSVPYSVSTTLSSFSLTTPGGIPVSRPVFATTLPGSASIVTHTSILTSLPTGSILSSKSYGGSINPTHISGTMSIGILTLSSSVQSHFIGTMSIGTMSMPSSSSRTHFAVTMSMVSFSGSQSTTTAAAPSSTLSAFSFNPSPTSVTHTFADGTVTTTVL